MINGTNGSAYQVKGELFIGKIKLLLHPWAFLFLI
jgi:hypothetical protein